MNLTATLKKAIKFFPQEVGDCVWRETVDLQKAIAKLKELRTKKDRQGRYTQHLQRQEERLERIALILNRSPQEAQECLELMVEYLSSEGILKRGMAKLQRERIQGNINNDVKMFLLQNGLCD
jgi:hypothetical protein